MPERAWGFKSPLRHSADQGERRAKDSTPGCSEVEDRAAADTAPTPFQGTTTVVTISNTGTPSEVGPNKRLIIELPPGASVALYQDGTGGVCPLVALLAPDRRIARRASLPRPTLRRADVGSSGSKFFRRSVLEPQGISDGICRSTQSHVTDWER